MKVKQIKKIFLTITVALSFGISNQAHAFFIDYNAQWMANQGLKNAREQEKRNRERYEEMYGEDEYNNLMSKKTSSNKKNTSLSTSAKTVTSTKKAKITFKPDGNTKGLDDLVLQYPSNKRAQVKPILKKLQDSFPQVARSVGIPTNDLSTGMAAVVAGAYMAYNNVSLNDNYMKPIANQFKEAMQSVSEFDKMSDSQKKYIYDQMVIIGMTLAVSQSENQQNPNAKTTAQLRQAGKKVLEGLLGVSASKVRITASGLSY